ncbi:DUF4136 domain-containing protein [Pyxidicoccus fallax]|uniref:DUF4136 domain-containing protein n=1 Tax=Pyxidicoccus fallax TaxID=394095 RepID=A0A848LS54_9BACT|nr:DUF4136 domain-containing protein [Pyxidicoccus fallax]NMO20521.1 DUF4136 domain-containing protein [Pyxidicoccus fallax]NPC83709.1 DUF4136 domain-containing protein [Pyxidicoccus fallax]
MLLRLAPPLLALTLAACSRINVNTQHDSSAAKVAGGYRTYAWRPLVEGEAPRVFSPGTDISVEKSVDAYLQSRGYRRVEASESPDFLIRWRGAVLGRKVRLPGIRQSPILPGDPRYYQPDRYLPTPPSEPVENEVPKGTLDLDIVDAGSKKPVWQGTVQGELVDDAEAGDVQDWLNEAIPKLLGDFPPKAG